MAVILILKIIKNETQNWFYPVVLTGVIILISISCKKDNNDNEDSLGISWQRSFGGSICDRAYSIQPITDGGYIVVGYSSPCNGDVTVNNVGYDFWILKLNAKGEL